MPWNCQLISICSRWKDTLCHYENTFLVIFIYFLNAFSGFVISCHSSWFGGNSRNYLSFPFHNPESPTFLWSQKTAVPHATSRLSFVWLLSPFPKHSNQKCDLLRFLKATFKNAENKKKKKKRQQKTDHSVPCQFLVVYNLCFFVWSLTNNNILLIFIVHTSIQAYLDLV